MTAELQITSLKVEMWPVKDLTPYDTNVKKHEKDQVKKIAAAILKTGKFDQPIVVDRNGVIIKGHGRRLAAIELGLKTVPVVVHADLTPAQVKAMRLDDNRVAMSDIDSDMLRLELDFLKSEGMKMDDTFDLKEIEHLEKDSWEINDGAFVEDMEEVIENQRKDTQSKADAASEARIPLAKAFGFKDIPISSQIHINRLMAKAEAATGLERDEALAVFAAAL